MSKAGYYGVNTEFPIYENQTVTKTKNLSIADLGSFFLVTNGTTANTMWDESDATDATGKIKLVPGNIGANSTTATITLQTARALTGVVISGAYYTESGYDKITLSVAGSTVLNAVSGTSAQANRWSGSLAKDAKIVLTYTKDGSNHATGEANTVFYIACDGFTTTETTPVKVGSTYREVARKIENGYWGVTEQVPKYEVTTTRTDLMKDNADSYLTTNIGTTDPWLVTAMSTGRLEYCINSGSSNWKANTEYDLFVMVDKALKGVKLTLIAQFTTSSANNLLSLTVAGNTLYNRSGTDVPIVSVGGAIYQTYSIGDVAAQTSIYLKYRTAATGSVNGNPNTVSLSFTEGYEETVTKTYVGTEEKDVAHEIVKAYFGDANGIARQWFSKGTKVTYTGTSSFEPITVDGVAYNLYTLTSSGTLTINGPVNSFLVGGGGAGESTPSRTSTSCRPGFGGGGGWVTTHALEAGEYAVTIGTGGTASGGSGGTTSITAGGASVASVYGGNRRNTGTVAIGTGGSGGGVNNEYNPSSSSWSSNGPASYYGNVSTIPFGISSLDPCSAGGTAGRVFAEPWSGSGGTYYYGGAGGSNGAQGQRGSTSFMDPAEKGGGNGGIPVDGNGGNATFYGSGGGGAASAWYTDKTTAYNLALETGTGGSGYQGVVYLLAPA